MTAEEVLKEQLANEQAAHKATQEALGKLTTELDAARAGLLSLGVELGEARSARESMQKIASTAETTSAALRIQIAKAHAALDEVVNAK